MKSIADIEAWASNPSHILVAKKYVEGSRSYDVDAFTIEIKRQISTLGRHELAYVKCHAALLLYGLIGKDRLETCFEVVAVSPLSELSYSWHGRPDLIAAQGAAEGMVESYDGEMGARAGLYSFFADLIRVCFRAVTDPELKSFLGREIAFL